MSLHSSVLIVHFMALWQGGGCNTETGTSRILVLKDENCDC